VHLGSWAIFCDIAGQVSESPANPVVTTAAVGVPSDVCETLRRRLVRAFGGAAVKWKHGKLEGLRLLQKAAAPYHYRAAVLDLYREAESWTRFYRQAAEFRDRARADTGKRLWYLDGNEVMRMLLMGEGFSQLIGRLLRSRHPWGDREATLDLVLVVDTDIREAESRAQFSMTLEQWAKESRLHRALGVSPSIVARVQTEQEEPLLLLADYLAGLYQHADPRSRLDFPVVTPEDASRAVSELRRCLGGRLYEMTDEFDFEYPLAFSDAEIEGRWSGRT
jgi:hypothetical protein